jgi:hypothetical protein
MFARFAMILAAALVLAGTARAETQLIYLNDCCIRDASDPRAGAYEAVAAEIRHWGFNVAFSLDTGDGSELEVQRRVAATADRVLGLLAGGEFAENITVVGHGLGATTALIASGLIANRRVNYILLGGCPEPAGITVDYAKTLGRFLSITDGQDPKSASCHGKLPQQVFYKEIGVASPAEGSLFLRTDEESVWQWLDPVYSFVTGKGSRRRR